MKNIFIWLAASLVMAVLLNYAEVTQMSFDSFLVGYVSSIVIVASSAYSFSHMVKSRVENMGELTHDDRDMIDKMEDPYMLYEDEDISMSPKETKPQKLSMLAALKGSGASLSIYRIASYLLLVLGFFYLRDNKLFYPVSYIIGLTVPVVVIVMSLFAQRSKS